MPTCRRCLTKFKTCAVIDGKLKVLGNRKYCLTCSPFKAHNTRAAGPRTKNEKSGLVVVTCRGCDKEFHPTRSKGHRGERCNSCITNEKNRSVKEKIISLKGGKCCRCGYNKNVAALDLHHRDPSKKEFQIGANLTRSWGSIEKEIDKCDLVCANCHREIHAPLAQR